MKAELTPEQMLADMGLHARSSVVHVEPPTVAAWRECIGHVLCGAAFDVGLAQAEEFEVLRAAVGLAKRTEREACALDLEQAGWVEATSIIRARGGR